MPSISSLRRKIKGVKSTKQITKAMTMIAGARLYKAQRNILNARPFAVKLNELLAGLTEKLSTQNKINKNWKNDSVHFLLERNNTNRIGLLVVAGDKGLCGAFNNNVLRKASEIITQNKDKEFKLYVVGRKAQEYFKRLGLKVENEYINIFSKLGFVHAELIGNDLMKVYKNDKLSKIVLVYNEFKSAIQQNLIEEQLLPIENQEKTNKKYKTNYIYEPDKIILLSSLLPRFVKARIYRVLLESYAAELSARMTAMDNASKNAGEMIDNLTLYMNKIRQTNITRDLADIVGTIEALK
ncbi:MAG: ATP synthase F1 subunit gamma [Elusimicrobia bacterium RIFOXYA2_FULL_39_19]|nr:MAG: ATP synthase F1 subunit gamma [Elusimicrobia bacterium RIFOXYA2_FULL_39_19]